MISVAMFVAGTIVLDLQRGREVSDAHRWMLTVSYGIAVAFIAGSVLCLVAVVLGRRRRALRPLVAGAVLLTLGVLVPTHFTAALPLIVAVWGYVFVLRNELRDAQ